MSEVNQNGSVGQPWASIVARVEQRRERVVELTRINLSANEIAAILNTTRRTVVRDRHEMKCTQSTDHIRPLTDAERNWAELALDDGASVMEVARTLGRSRTTIRRHFPDKTWTREQIAEYAAIVRRRCIFDRQLRRVS